MKKHALEPGLLSIFRIYVLIRLFVMLAVGDFFAVEYGVYLESVQIPYIILFLTNVFLLLIYLSWSWPRRRLGRLYLPLALTVAAIGPIIEARYLFIIYDTGYLARLWLVFPFLSIPLILTAWQYSFRHVLLFCLGTALVELALIRTSEPLSSINTMADVGSVIIRSVFFVFVGYIVSDLMTAQREQRRQLAEANRKLVRYAATLEQLAVSRERNRLARELHDTLAHTLSGLAVQLEAVAAVWDDIPPRARVMVERALTLTREGLDETRRALYALRAAPIENLGLALAIRGLAENAADRGGLLLQLNVSEQITDLSPEVEQTFYRVAQEALENVVLHADASEVRVSLEQTDHELLLEVSDDGTGFPGEEAIAGDRLGLRGMRERAELIGGSLEVVGRREQGTTVRLRYRGGAA